MTILDYFSALSYSITAIGYLMTRILWLRVFIMIGCVMDAGIYFFVRPGEPLWVQVVMNLLFAVINGVAVVGLIRDQFPPGFYGEIGELYKNTFYQLAPSEFRALLAIGEWRDTPKGKVLIREGEINIDPMIIINGTASIEQNNRVITSLGKFSILGEINFLTNMPPQNSVISETETRLFVLPRARLMNLIEKNQVIKAVIYSTFGCNIAVKLKAMNEKESLQPL